MINAFGSPAASNPGDTTWEGDSGAAARANHRHAREVADANLSGTPTTSAVGDAAAVGTSTTGAHSDHRHGREAFATSPADVAAAASAGTATTVPHGDHVHADPAKTAWTTFTPAWKSTGTQPAIGNGTLTGAWKQNGKTLYLRVSLVAGTTTTFGTGAWLFDLPNSLTGAASDQEGACQLSSANLRFPAYAVLPSGLTQVQVISVSSSAGVTMQNVDATHPATWAANSNNFLSFLLVAEVQ